MKNNKEFTAEQMLQINKMLNKANFEMNRKENLVCNIARVSEKEIFKNLGDIPGYEQFSDYEVSNFGNVKSLKLGKEKLLKPGTDKDGYLRINLYKNEKMKNYKIHRLVAAAFCYNDNPEVKTQVNHINHNPKDNFYRNLEYCSPKENILAFYDYDEEAVATKRRKNSEFMKKYTGEKNPFFGKKHSEETKMKISEAKKGKYSGEKHYLYGKKLSEETKRKISETKLAKKSKSS